jgi:hypothetical protein
MTVAQFEQLEDAEAERVIRWRFDELARAGFDPSDALVLATHLEVDLHLAATLVSSGCPQETALRILL